MFIIPVGATTISIRETVATRNYLGEFVFSEKRTERIKEVVHGFDAHFHSILYLH